MNENDVKIQNILDAQHSLGIKMPIPVVCPVCHGPLDRNCPKPECPDCVRNFSFDNSFPDLIVGERFPDSTDDTCLSYEETSNADLTHNYWFPLFNTLWPHRTEYQPRILSLGCGTGMDVDILAEYGFNIVGIEIGNRTRIWLSRRHKERLMLANGKYLPFEDESFDCVYCGCVFPHVGVEGDSFTVTPDYLESREKLAGEMFRVLKSSGKIFVSSPNRKFPLDIFHGRNPGSYTPRINWPSDPCLLSVGDYKKIFSKATPARATALPVNGYWGFVRSRKSLKGFLLGIPVRLVFHITSALPFLRGSCIDPWIVVQLEKTNIDGTG